MFVIELFKAQNFFALANSIAALVVTSRGGFDSTTLRSFQSSARFLMTMIRLQLVLTSFTFSLLILLGLCSFFLVLLLVMNLGLAYFLNQAIWSWQGLTPSDANNPIPNLSSRDLLSIQTVFNQGPPECGGHSPWAWCIVDQNVPASSSVIGVLASAIQGLIIAFVLLNRSDLCIRYLLRSNPCRLADYESFIEPVTVALTFLQLARPHVRANDIVFRTKSGSFSERIVRENLHRRSWWMIGFWSSLCLVWTAIAGLLIYEFTWLYKQKFSALNWGFGQIVALMIWLPPIAEWLNVEFRGMIVGLQSKMVQPYIVTTQAALDEARGEALSQYEETQSRVDQMAEPLR